MHTSDTDRPHTTPHDAASAQSQRSELRRSSLARRDALATSDRAEAERAITKRLLELLDAHHVRHIHCYLSFRSEVETRPFLELALARGLGVAVPTITRERPEGPEVMHHVALTSLADGLDQAAYGIEEPRKKEPADLDELGAVILPLAAFDRRGTRLGYGKGFYDRFLATLPRAVLRIGVAFATQEVPSIPRHDHDEALDLVITERELIDCRHQRQA